MKLYSLKPIFWSWKRRGRIRLIVQWKEDCILSHTSDEIERNFQPGTKPNWMDQISKALVLVARWRDRGEIESYALQIAEVAGVSLAPDLCLKRRPLILANLNIVLEEYLSVVIFDIIAILNLSFYFVVRFAFYFTSTLLCSFMLPYKVQWVNFRVLLTWARLLEFNFLRPIKSGFDQKTPRCTKLPLEMAHRI